MPKRIQRSRAKGWRSPEGAIYVGRPTKFGNPYRVGLAPCGCRSVGECTHNTLRVWDAATAVEGYRAWIEAWRPERRAWLIETLRGHDLVCWCPLVDANGLPVPCHADVLLALANGFDAAGKPGVPRMNAPAPEHPRPYTVDGADRRIAPWMANEIWHVLIEECGLRRDDRGWEHYAFIAYLDREAGWSGHDYRFMGALGSGGKFYNDGHRWRVGCYGEDRTPAREGMITRANERLAALRQAYTVDGADG